MNSITILLLVYVWVISTIMADTQKKSRNIDRIIKKYKL
jgi:hypothetical protein